MFVYYISLLARVLCVKRGDQDPWIGSAQHTLLLAASADDTLVHKYFSSNKGRENDDVAMY